MSSLLRGKSETSDPVSMKQAIDEQVEAPIEEEGMISERGGRSREQICVKNLQKNTI